MTLTDEFLKEQAHLLTFALHNTDMPFLRATVELMKAKGVGVSWYHPKDGDLKALTYELPFFQKTETIFLDERQSYDPELDVYLEVEK